MAKYKIRKRSEARDSAPPDTAAEPAERIRDRVLRIEREEREAQERAASVEEARVRDAAARDLEPAVRDTAVSEANESAEAEKLTHEIKVEATDGGEPIEGQEAKILIKNSVGEEVNILSIFPETAERRPIQLVYGRKLELAADSADVKGNEPRRITIPVDFSSRDLPYLVREITRAIYDNETEIRRGKQKDDGKKAADQIHQTTKGTIIHKELVARQKKEEGLEKIKSEYEGADFRITREVYSDLEMTHSLASRSAERVIDELAEKRFLDFEQAIGKSIFVDYDGRQGFKKDQLHKTMVRQSELVHQFDKDGNLVLLGRPAVDVNKIQPITALKFFSGYYGLERLYHGEGWDIPIFKGRIGAAIRDSEVATDLELLRKIHDVPKDSGSLDNSKVFKKMVIEHWKAGFVPALIATELSLKPFRFAQKKARHWLSQGLFDLNKLTGQLMLGKKWEPKWKTEAKLDEEKEKMFAKLKDKAMGKMA